MESDNLQNKLAPEKPEPPRLTNITHHSIECSWKHVRDKFPRNQRIKFILENQSQRNRGVWNTVYAGFGITKLIEGLEAANEFYFRLIVQGPKNQRSECSDEVTVKTEREPLTGDNLHKAIQLEKLREVEEILNSEHGPRIMEIPDKFDHLPLMIAVQKSSIELVELLIYKGATVNAQNETGKTALMLAAFYGRINIIKELNNNGATYGIKDKAGGSVLHYAIDGGHVDAIQYILMDGHEVDPVNKHGWTPLLRLASMNGSKDCAEMLIKYNANLNVLDVNKKNALTVAVLTGNLPLVQLLIEYGASIEATNEYGKTAYDIAIALDKRKVIKYFEDTFNKDKLLSQ